MERMRSDLQDSSAPFFCVVIQANSNDAMVTADLLPSSTCAWFFSMSFNSFESISMVRAQLAILVSLMAMKNKCDDADRPSNESTRKKKNEVESLSDEWNAKLVNDVDVELDGMWQWSATMFCSDNDIRLVAARRRDSSFGFWTTREYIITIFRTPEPDTMHLNNFISATFYWNFSWHRKRLPIWLD